ncbi:hypothetical protein MMC26_001480 [Xylographa opegraphella]|nr:hypothetical protein [Xylographa opegraphella]
MDGLHTTSAAAAEHQTGEHEPFDRGYTPQVSGVLVRTVVPSPLIRWILPARIRHKNKSDVIFVGDSSIEVKEYRGDSLYEVVTKDDFDATIRAARVIGTPPILLRAEQPSGLDAITKKEDTGEASADAMGLDLFASPEVPPQILVLAMESGLKDKLLFLFAFYDPSQRIRFLSYEHPLLYHKRYAQRLGKHVAVDPRSRAMAVAATSGSFIVYTLKTMAQLREEVESPAGLLQDKFVPIKSERLMKLDGVILKMEFLHPRREDEYHVVLLIVFSIGERIKLRVYDWDHAKDLQSIVTGGDFLVGSNKRVPLLLIPFTLTTGFILVSEDTMAFYHNIFARSMVPAYLKHAHEDIKEPGSSRRLPLFTSWARPTRREDWNLKNDAFYLCREDGVVLFLEFCRDALPLSIKSELGGISVNVDTAFAVLFDGGIGNSQIDGRSYDMLVAAGDMSNGVVARFEARKRPEPHKSIPNWAPMMDFCTAHVAPDFASSAARPSIPYESRIHEHERVFGCFGRGRDHGAVGEIQMGVEASSRINFEINNGTTGMWILPDVSGSSSSTCVLMTNLEDMTTLLRIQNDGSGAEEIVDLEDLCGIDVDSVTLTAGSTLAHVVIQITKRSIRALSPQLGCRFIHTFEKETVTLAHIDGQSSAILIATNNNFLHYGEFVIRNREIALGWIDDPVSPFSLASEASCVYLVKFEQYKFAFVGTTAGQLHLFRVDHKVGLTLLLTHDFHGDFAICDSIAVIARDTENIIDPLMAVVCGLRNGSIHNFFFDVRNGNVTLELTEFLSLGTTTVTVRSDTSSYSGPNHLCRRALISCAENFCRLYYQPSRWASYQTVIQNVWLSAPDQPSIRQSHITCVAQADPWIFDQESVSGFLFFINDSRLHLTELDNGLRSSPIVRKMPVPGTPNRIAFSRLLNMLAVAFTTIRVREFQEDRTKGLSQRKRLVYPTLMFLDPNGRHTQDSKDLIHGTLYSATSEPQRLPLGVPMNIGPSGTKVLGLMEWRPSVLGKEFPLLVVNTLRTRKGGRANSGSIQIYHITKNAPTTVVIELKHNISVAKPVYSLASYGASSLVFCSGTTLSLRTMADVDGVPKWVVMPGYELNTMALHISIREPYIYLSTASNSVMVFKVEDTLLVPQTSDTSGRSGLHHLLIPNRSLILSANTEKTLAGLWQSPEPPLDRSSRTVFEAILPVSIRKLCEGSIKPPWLIIPETSPRVILGSSIDGSFRQFELINEDTWRLLRFIQNMAERNATLCPYTYAESLMTHIEPRLREKCMEIKGDLLCRLLDRGSPDTAALLHAMLEKEPDLDRRAYDFDTWQARQQRFFEIVDIALEPTTLQKQDRVKVVVDFLRRKILPPVI